MAEKDGTQRWRAESQDPLTGTKTPEEHARIRQDAQEEFEARLEKHTLLLNREAERHAGVIGLPSDAAERKATPIVTGVLDFFPDAIAAVARVSYTATEQHHPGEPMHWDRAKSADEADSLVRHLLQRGTLDGDGQPHSAKVAWRALAMLQKEIETTR